MIQRQQALNDNIASRMILVEEGTVSAWILENTKILDNVGVAEWSPFYIAIGTTVLLCLIKSLTNNAGGVCWWGLLHAMVSGYGSLACVWISMDSAVALTATSEPLRSVLCQGPLTSLHGLIPAISMGYGVVDIIEGFNHGIDFILHGLATFTIMAYFCSYDVAEIIVPMLLMEISTVHLNLMKADFFSDTAIAINMFFFTVTFFVSRIFVCPYLWLDIFITTYTNADNPESQACLPWHFKWMVFSFGMFFNCLNVFWGYKIILKIRRKLLGLEKVKQGNELKNK